MPARAARASGSRASGRPARGSPRPTSRVRKTSAAIASFVSPEAASSAIRRSVALSPAAPRRAAVRASSPRARSAQSSAPSRSKTASASSSASRAARFCLRRRWICPWTRSVRARSNGIGQRSCAATARSSGLPGGVELPAGREQQRPAPRGDGQAPRDARACGGLLEASRRAPRHGRAARLRRRLDRVAVQAPDRGLAEVHPLDLGQRLGEVPVGGRAVAGGQLGEAEAALPEHLDDRLLRPAAPERVAHGLERPAMRVDVRLPDAACRPAATPICSKASSMLPQGRPPRPSRPPSTRRAARLSRMFGSDDSSPSSSAACSASQAVAARPRSRRRSEATGRA